MNVKKLWLTSMSVVCGFVSLAAGDELEKMDADIAKQYGKHIAELFTKDLKDVALTFDVDSELASGLHAEEDGILMVPMKGMKEGTINPDVEKETGAGLCYLFLSPRYQPHVDGKPIDVSKLLTVKFTDGEGNSREALAMIVTIKHAEGDDWRLYAFGKEKTPLIKSQFGIASGSAKGVVDLSVDSPREGKANLTFTIVGKYAASFPISVK